MNAPFASRIPIRLRAHEEILDLVSALDDEACARFLAASRFAEHALSEILSALTNKPSFLIVFEDMSLLIEFCRIREMFMIMSFADLRDDPQPPRPGATSRPVTNVEHLLKAVGMDSALHIAKDNASDSLRDRKEIFFFRPIPFDDLDSTLLNEDRSLSSTTKFAPPPLSANDAPVSALSDLRIFAIRWPARLVSSSPPIVRDEKDAITFRPPVR